MPTRIDRLPGKGSRFAEVLRLLRNARGLGLRELAELAKMPASTISYYERGVRLPNRTGVRALAKVLSIDPSILCWYAFSVREAGAGKKDLFQMVESLMEEQLGMSIAKKSASPKKVAKKPA
jgi:transcriptional regulator with XRE-family HTH domain